MSTLLLNELFDGVEFNQPIRIDKHLNIAHIRPWIYKHGTLVDGDLQVEVLQGATVLATSSINYTTINAAFTDDYAHGFIRFDFDSLILRVAEGNATEDYIFRFTMQNHTTDPSNFIGIVRRYEAKTYSTYGTGVVNNEAPADTVEPAGLEIYEFKII